MNKFGLAVIASVLVLSGCLKQQVEARSNEVETVVADERPLTPEDFSSIGAINIESTLNAKLVAATIKAVGLRVNLEGSPANMEELLVWIHERADDLSRKHVEIIHSLPDGDLKTSVKEAMIANEHFHRVAASVTTSTPSQWASEFREAQRRIDEASAKLSAELKLAKN